MSIHRSLTPLQRSRFEEMVNFPKLIKTVFYIALFAVGFISINVLQDELNFSNISVLILLGIILLLFILFRRGYPRLAGLGLIIAVSGVITYNLVIAGGIHDNAMVIFPVLIIASGLVMGRRFIPVMTGIVLTEVGGIFWLTAVGAIQPFGGAIEVTVHSFITVMVLLIITGAIIWITVITIERNFLQLVESENNLRQSYDKTIVGWGKALELFDRETEGHSQRVMRMTLRIAGLLEIPEEEQEHIRRGALLHDIGKMGISEEILNKRSSLNDQERQLVEEHPLMARQLLRDIPFLEKALEIPVYHHERWDGTGYPYGIFGENIPLAARIFALADNWDALTSNRPYRTAWPEEQVIHYIESQSSLKFDPDLVALFLDNLDYLKG